MFRGLHINELRAIIAIIFLTFVGFAAHSYFTRTAQPALITGDHEAHDPGVLVQESPEAGVVITPDETPAAAADIATAGLININRATADELTALPGIGPSRSKAIVATRERLGGFHSLNQLTEVHGIGDKTLERLRPYLTIGDSLPVAATPPPIIAESAPRPPTPVPTPAVPQYIRVNYGDSEELQRMSGIGPKLAERILEDRRLNGFYHSPEDLLRVKGIGPKTIEKNRDLMIFH